MNRIVAGGCWLALLLVAAGCGYEPPTPGEIAVTSDPEGATVALDGQPTGLLTPTVLPDLDSGVYRVSVEQDGVIFRPAQKNVEVYYGTRSLLHFETGAGSLQVTSTPSGAAIILDGAATGEVTPYTFGDVDPGDYEVDVALPHHRSLAGPVTVTVAVNAEAAVDLSLAIGTVVLFEGFSNVSCTGCPTMLTAVKHVMEDHGFDRLLFIKYAGPTPNGADPMWLSNMQMVRDRAQYLTGLQTPALPTLCIQGALAGGFGTPPDAAGLEQAAGAGHLAPVDFYLTVTAPAVDDLSVREVTCEIAVTAPHAGVDLAGHQLRAVLVYSEVHTAQVYNPGGDRYYWVARRDAQVTASIGEVTPAGAAIYTVTLVDPDPALLSLTPYGREVIVFVQNNATKAVVQAGSTMAERVAPLILATPGGTR